MRIELEGLTKRFGSTTALGPLTLTIPAGQRVALIGPNGSGKSTLLRALMGLISCDGSVLLDGRSPFADRAAVAAQLAYVPQVAPQLGAPVDEVVRSICELRELPLSRVEALCGELELDLAAIAARPFRNLSGGMKQKLLIALALASDAKLLVLDEPTASLDAAARERFFRLLSRTAPSATVLLCSHRLEEIRHLVQHVVSLEEGKLAFQGTAAEYLGAHAHSVVELCVKESGRHGYLEANGFAVGHAGWWSRTVSQAEKLSVISDVTRELGATLENLVVRDLESVDATQGAHHG